MAYPAQADQTDQTDAEAPMGQPQQPPQSPRGDGRRPHAAYGPSQDGLRAPHGQKIRFKLAEVARAKGVISRKGPHKGKVTLTAIMAGTGCAYTTIFDMLRYPDKPKGISWDVLAKLCAFLDCQPGDLIEYVADPDTVKYQLPKRDWTDDGSDKPISGWDR